MQLEQTQPLWHFGIKYPQVSPLSLYTLNRLQPDAKAWKPPHYVTFFLPTGPHLFIVNLALTVSFLFPPDLSGRPTLKAYTVKWNVTWWRLHWVQMWGKKGRKTWSKLCITEAKTEVWQSWEEVGTLESWSHPKCKIQQAWILHEKEAVYEIFHDDMREN